MAFIDYYKILGVSKDIPQKDIRSAYRKRAKQFHPDLHPNDPKAKAKFQALNEAYDVLSDPQKRAQYDKYGEQWRNAEAFGHSGAHGGSGGGNPFEGFDFSTFSSGGGGFSSFFQDLFGGGSGGFSRFGARGQGTAGFGGGEDSCDTEASVNIDMYTALLGGEVVIQLSTGTKLKLKVKPYTQNGTKVRLRGKGRPRVGGGSGDLILTYHVNLPTHLSERQQELLRQMQNA